MKKKLSLLFTALAMAAMSLTSCGSKADVWTVSDGHLYHNDSDMGLVVGPQGDKGDQGEKGDTGDQGPKGDKGDTGDTGATGAQGETGAQGPKGDTGEQGPQGEKGDAGNGIESVEVSNDGYVDTHTLTFTDGSTYSFGTYNPATAIEVINNRVDEDENGDEIELPYFVGTSAELDITVNATFLNRDVREIDNFTVEGFDTATAGKKDVVVKFGDASDAFAVDVMTLTEAVAEGFANDESLTSLGIVIEDEVPAMSNGAADYAVGSSAFFIIPDEDLAVDDAIALYQGDLELASYTDAGEDSYGDKHFTSPNNELDVCAWNYYDIAIRVDITVLKKAPTPAGITISDVLYGILSAFYGTTYTMDDFVSYNVASEGEGYWYGYVSFGSGSADYFNAVIETVEPKLPKYLEADGDAYDTTYDGSAALEKDFVTTDGTIVVEVIANLYNSKLYADFYVYEAE